MNGSQADYSITSSAHEVTGEELEQMEAETLSVGEDFSFALAGFTIAITIGTTLLTVDIASERLFNSFLIVMILGFLVALYCGIKWLRKRKSFSGAVIRIKKRVGPLGEEGNEINSVDLASLPAGSKKP